MNELRQHSGTPLTVAGIGLGAGALHAEKVDPNGWAIWADNARYVQLGSHFSAEIGPNPSPITAVMSGMVPGCAVAQLAQEDRHMTRTEMHTKQPPKVDVLRNIAGEVSLTIADDANDFTLYGLTPNQMRDFAESILSQLPHSADASDRFIAQESRAELATH
jgi:hypothetical protein